MTSEDRRLDVIGQNILDTMERGRKLRLLSIGLAATLELAMLIACVELVDWGDRLQMLLMLIFLLSYFILLLGMVALAGHVTNSVARILAVMDAREQ